VKTARKIYSLLTVAERRSAAVLLGLMLIGMVLETLGIGLVIPAMTLLTQEDVAARLPTMQSVIAVFGTPTQSQIVAGGMLALVAVYLIKALYLAFLGWRQARFAFDGQVRLSQRLFAIYLRQPYTFHLQRNSAQLIQNALFEVDQFTFNVILPAMVVMAEGLVVLSLCTLLLIVEPLGALIVVLVVGAAAWVFHGVTGAWIARWGLERQLHQGLRILHLQQGLGGAKEVKLLGREKDFLERYDLHNIASARVGRRQVTIQQLPRLWLELLAVAGLATLVLSMLALGRNMAAIVPTLGLFAAAAFRLIPSMNRLLVAVQSLRYCLPVIDTLHDELGLGEPELSSQGSQPFAPADRTAFQTDIRLSDIVYSYPGAAAPALNGLSIRVRKGESVGFTGPSGSGKSTLVDVILGLLTPGGGRVEVDGQDIHRNPRAWQDQIGYVPQSIYLTDDTLRRNVAFGLSDAQIDDAAVKRAITAAQLEEFVASLPDGLETLVGERGIRLSGGQRQRIGIARALYHDPAVLVLDEATSSLDGATERDVMKAVTALQGTKTILIVAHRLSTVAECGRLYRLEHGRVTQESGPDARHHAGRSVTEVQT